MLILKIFILLALANGTPVIANKLLRERFAWPLDGGIQFLDGQPLFGTSKTLRGVALAALVTSAAGALLGLGWQVGALVGILSMTGDLFSSFVKRRMKLPPSSRAVVLDQVPEALFPLLACQATLGLTLSDIVTLVAIFALSDILLSPVFYKLKIRKRPY